MSKWPSFIDKQQRPSNVIHIAPQTTIDDRVMAVERAQDKVRATHEAHEAARLGFRRGTIASRKRLGWSDVEAVKTPAMYGNRPNTRATS